MQSQAAKNKIIFEKSFCIVSDQISIIDIVAARANDRVSISFCGKKYRKVAAKEISANTGSTYDRIRTIRLELDKRIAVETNMT